MFHSACIARSLKLKTCAMIQRQSAAKEPPRDTRPVQKRTRPLITSSFLLLLFAFRIRPRSASASCHLSTRFAPASASVSFSLFSLSACVLVVGPSCHKQLASLKCRARARVCVGLVHARPPARLRPLSHRQRRAEAGVDRYEPA